MIIEKKEKKRIGAFVILTILTSIMLCPTVTAVTLYPGPPDGRIEMNDLPGADDEWIGMGEPPGGRIIFDRNDPSSPGVHQIEIMYADVGIGTMDPQARFHVKNDRGIGGIDYNPIITEGNGAWFEQRFMANDNDIQMTAVCIEPELDVMGYSSVDTYGLRIQPRTPAVTSNIENWYAIYIEDPETSSDPPVPVSIDNTYALVTELNAGNVGIGMINPEQRLVVEGAIRIGTNDPSEPPIDGTIRYSQETTPGTYDFEGRLGGIWVSLTGSGGGDTDWQIIGSNVVTGHGGGWPAGNVGIGTTNPQAKLDVNGNVAIGGATAGSFSFAHGILSSANGFSSNTLGGIQAHANGLYSTAIGSYIIAEAENSFIIGSCDGSAFLINNIENSLMVGFDSDTPTLYVDGNSIGVGTITPQNKLDVEGSVAIGSTYSGTSAAPVDGAIIEGNVGIGTINPVTTLDINGGLATNIITFESTEFPPVSQYTVTDKDHTILVKATTADAFINLRPADEAEGQILVIKLIDPGLWPHTVTIDPYGTETIDGANTYTLITQWESIGIQSDGDNWFILY